MYHHLEKCDLKHKIKAAFTFRIRVFALLDKVLLKKLTLETATPI